MISKGNKAIRNVNGISDKQELRIIDFLQGSVYCWCKNKKGEWFALRDLMGGDNYFWSDTPLFVLYEKHKIGNTKEKTAVEKAAKDAGWILKKMIAIDKREFESKEEGLTRKYRWTGKELNR